MRALAFFEKTFLENIREWKILILALTFAPFFIYLMYAYFGATAPSYKLLVLNHDRTDFAVDVVETPGARGLIAEWERVMRPDGKPVFKVTEVEDVASAEVKVKNRDADLLIEIPEGFSRSLVDFRDRKAADPARVINHGDETNVRSSMAMAFSDHVAYTYAISVTNTPMPLAVDFRRLGVERTLSEFDLYVPALLVLSLIMVLFTAAGTLMKEVEKGTMSRLKLSRLSATELLAAVSLNQVLIGVAALAFAFLAAFSVGYRAEGSLVSLLIVGAVSTLSVVAISVLVAAFLNSVFELLTIGCFPFFILMFFSESMFPLPKITLFQVAGNTVYANDILPTSLTVRAFNQILNYGAGLQDIVFELCVILLLTAVYFALGVWCFQRRHKWV